jgi:hypothetical protein
MQRIAMDVTHPIPTKLKFILGGRHLSYPGFNGQFKDVFYSIEKGAFLDKISEAEARIKDLLPSTKWGRMAVTIVLDDPKQFVPNEGDKQEVPIGGVNDAFPDDYAISGWFRWA